MTETADKRNQTSWLSTIWSARHDPAARIFNIDLIAIFIAIFLPWTTTGVSIMVVLWIASLAFAAEPRALLRSLKRPISILPIAFFGLVLVGTLWSEGTFDDKLQQLSHVSKLLVLPLFIYHFQRSPRGLWVFVAFLVSCLVLALISCITALDPDLSAKLYFSRGSYVPVSGIFVKSYIDQGQEFSLCAVALAYPIVASWRQGRTSRALMLATVALALVVNMMFVVISRTALVTMPLMLFVFLLLHLRLRIAIATLVGLALLTAGAWYGSPHLRETVGKFFIDYRETFLKNNESGMGSRLIYWEKALSFFVDAPVIGHGTGSTRQLFERAGVGETGARAKIVSDPHNQTLNVAIQWGTLGVFVLFAMWLVHLRLFSGEGLVSWIGLLVVVQNILTSVLNSHLFDFIEGWIYVIGVGIAGGMVLAQSNDPQDFSTHQTAASESKPSQFRV
jgi:O-antigen ligase